MSELMTEAEWAARDDLRKYWNAFCDCDLIPIDRDRFIERLEEYGLVEWSKVTKRDMQATSFAADLGLELGGMCWKLTAKGHNILNEPKK